MANLRRTRHLILVSTIPGAGKRPRPELLRHLLLHGLDLGLLGAGSLSGIHARLAART
jgi:hypothetical protein